MRDDDFTDINEVKERHIVTSLSRNDLEDKLVNEELLFVNLSFYPRGKLLLKVSGCPQKD